MLRWILGDEDYERFGRWLYETDVFPFTVPRRLVDWLARRLDSR